MFYSLRNADDKNESLQILFCVVQEELDYHYLSLKHEPWTSRPTS